MERDKQTKLINSREIISRIEKPLPLDEIAVEANQSVVNSVAHTVNRGVICQCSGCMGDARDSLDWLFLDTPGYNKKQREEMIKAFGK